MMRRWFAMIHADTMSRRAATMSQRAAGRAVRLYPADAGRQAAERAQAVYESPAVADRNVPLDLCQTVAAFADHVCANVRPGEVKVHAPAVAWIACDDCRDPLCHAKCQRGAKNYPYCTHALCEDCRTRYDGLECEACHNPARGCRLCQKEAFCERLKRNLVLCQWCTSAPTADLCGICDKMCCKCCYDLHTERRCVL